MDDNPGTKIVITERLPEIKLGRSRFFAQTLLATLQRTGGISDFRVNVNGLSDQVETFATGLKFTKIELVEVDNAEALKTENETNALEIRRKFLNADLAKIQQYIDQASLDELKDPQFLKRFIPAQKKKASLEEKVFDPKRNLKIEIVPDMVLQAGCLYSLSFQIEHVHSPDTVGQSQTKIYSFGGGWATMSSAYLEVEQGDPDLYLYFNGTYADGSSRGDSESEFVYNQQNAAGNWTIRVYGYGVVNRYILYGSWGLTG